MNTAEKIYENLDVLSLFAYADASHALEREQWMDFVRMILPLLLEISVQDVEHFFEAGGIKSTDDILKNCVGLAPVTKFIHEITMEIGVLCGMSPEFSLACFLELELPTRLHAPRKRSLKSVKSEMGQWLNCFAKGESNNGFINKVAAWKDAAHDLIGRDWLSESA